MIKKFTKIFFEEIKEFIFWNPSTRARNIGKINEFRDALENKDIIKVKELLREINLKEEENEENSALMVSAGDGNLEMCELLIENEASVNYRSDIGETPLGWAIDSKNIAVVKLLLDNGVNPNGTDIFKTPISKLALDAPKEIWDLLLKYGMRV